MNNISGKVATTLQGFGGILRCRYCAAEQPLGDVRNRVEAGWPKCCGYTMEWLTARQLDEANRPQT